MRDFSGSTYQRKKVAANKSKVQRQPLDLARYVRPFAKAALGLAGIALIATVAVVGYRALGKATFFRLKTIDITSTKRLSREDVLAIAGVEPGRDLLRMNLRRMGEQLAQNPWVETVCIRRFYPDGLSIAITERQPLAVVNMGYIYYMDTKGTIFKVLSQGDRLDYPVITGFNEEHLSSDPVGTKAALKTTCELLKVLAEKAPMVLADISEIHYDRGYGHTLYTASGALPIKVGSGDFAGKMERFSRIYRELMAQRPGLQYIDLDYNDKIVIKKS